MQLRELLLYIMKRFLIKIFRLALFVMLALGIFWAAYRHRALLRLWLPQRPVPIAGLPQSQEVSETDTAETPEGHSDVGVGGGPGGVFRVDIVWSADSDPELGPLIDKTVRALSETGGFAAEDIERHETLFDLNGQREAVLTALKDCDLLIVSPLSSDQAAAYASLCEEARVSAIFLGPCPEQEELKRWKDFQLPFCYIGTRSEDRGRAAGEALLLNDNPDINGDGSLSYIYLSGDPDNFGEQPQRYALEHALSESFELKLQEAYIADEDYDKGAQLMREALARFPDDLELAVCSHARTALGALSALNEVGRRDSVSLMALEGSRELLTALTQSELELVTMSDLYAQSQAVTETAAAFRRGERSDILRWIEPLSLNADSAGQLLDDADIK